MRDLILSLLVNLKLAKLRALVKWELGVRKTDLFVKPSRGKWLVIDDQPYNLNKILTKRRKTPSSR